MGATVRKEHPGYMRSPLRLRGGKKRQQYRDRPGSLREICLLRTCSEGPNHHGRVGRDRKGPIGGKGTYVQRRLSLSPKAVFTFPREVRGQAPAVGSFENHIPYRGRKTSDGLLGYTKDSPGVDVKSSNESLTNQMEIVRHLNKLDTSP